MRSRLLTLLVIILLALPITAAFPPVQAGPQPQELPAPTLAAKKRNKKPRFKKVTKTVRQSLTQTFTNADKITINDETSATPYPSTIDVSAFTNGAITDVNLLLGGFSHEWPHDVDMLLVPAQLPGQDAIVMSDIGAIDPVENITLTLDDQAAAALPDDGSLVSGTFQPTNVDDGVDLFADPAPTPSGNTLLSVFNGSNPNGTWQLFALDDATNDVGSIASWALQITADIDVQVQEQVPVAKDKKDKKKGKKGRGGR